ncbi:hypothetical protein [Saccharibacillus sp. JS10]|uniref:hypothetical protein n=1 Tax=Saccharibacillus sp. JS10 TaxID=2950552 RepID=UPI002109F959|nr:hypothetical protein [Saccharibacillus sp. JS10]MCQ4088651.1 hypothetical protein [Saccharibacillus sp. JS10]
MTVINFGFDLRRADPQYFQEVGQVVTIEEKGNDGKANLTLNFKTHPYKKRIQLLLEHDPWLRYTERAKRCADGVIIEYDATSPYAASIYIFELKRTIDFTKWSKVKTQFEGATLRALSFCTTIGLKPSEIRFHTVFSYDKILQKEIEILEAQQRVTGLIALKSLTGFNNREVREWNQTTVAPIEGSNLRLSHQHIQLQEISQTGIGKFDL